MKLGYVLIVCTLSMRLNGHCVHCPCSFLDNCSKVLQSQKNATKEPIHLPLHTGTTVKTKFLVFFFPEVFVLIMASSQKQEETVKILRRFCKTNFGTVFGKVLMRFRPVRCLRYLHAL